jgi:hypothetical protein
VIVLDCLLEWVACTFGSVASLLILSSDAPIVDFLSMLGSLMHPCNLAPLGEQLYRPW